jgi:hypothetical protein
VNDFDSHFISELGTIVPELLLKSKYVLEPYCQRVQEYTVLCISLEAIIEFRFPGAGVLVEFQVLEKEIQNSQSLYIPD